MTGERNRSAHLSKSALSALLDWAEAERTAIHAEESLRFAVIAYRAGGRDLPTQPMQAHAASLRALADVLFEAAKQDVAPSHVA
jgi:hypothetical protein